MSARSVSKPVLLRIIFVLIGIVWAISEQAFSRSGATVPLFDSIYKAFSITLLLTIAELVLELVNSQEDKKHGIDHFVRKNKGIAGSLARDLQNRLSAALKIKDNTVVIDHGSLAIESYKTFWEFLVDEQKKRAKSSPFIVQVIHSSAIAVWTQHPSSEGLLSAQQRFCLAGGKITRILCGQGAQPDSSVRTAADRMRPLGIEVFYFDLNRAPEIDHNFAWDFARVVQTGDVAIWDSFQSVPGGGIDEAIYLRGDEYKGRHLEDLWNRVKDFSQPL